MIGFSFKLLVSLFQVSLSALKRLNSQCVYVYTSHVPHGRDTVWLTLLMLAGKTNNYEEGGLLFKLQLKWWFPQVIGSAMHVHSLPRSFPSVIWKPPTGSETSWFSCSLGCLRYQLLCRVSSAQLFWEGLEANLDWTPDCNTFLKSWHWLLLSATLFWWRYN